MTMTPTTTPAANNRRHVCFARNLACSGCNPCRICFGVQVDNVLQGALGQIMPEAMFAARLTQQQADVLRGVMDQKVKGAMEVAYNALHEQMRSDPEVATNALDLSRVYVLPEGVHASRVHILPEGVSAAPSMPTMAAAVTSPLPRFTGDGYPGAVATPSPLTSPAVAAPAAAAAPPVSPAPVVAPALAGLADGLPPQAMLQALLAGGAGGGFPPGFLETLDPRVASVFERISDPVEAARLSDPKQFGALIAELSSIDAEIAAEGVEEDDDEGDDEDLDDDGDDAEDEGGGEEDVIDVRATAPVLGEPAAATSSAAPGVSELTIADIAAAGIPRPPTASAAASAAPAAPAVTPAVSPAAAPAAELQPLNGAPRDSGAP